MPPTPAPELPPTPDPLSDNFPLAWAAEQYGPDSVLGVAFKPRAANPGNGLEEYVGALLECSTRRHYATDDRRVLLVDTGARSAFEFNMSPKDMKRLYVSGARQAGPGSKRTTTIIFSHDIPLQPHVKFPRKVSTARRA